MRKMKHSLAIVFALVAVVFAHSDEEEGRKVIECFRQALDGGIESINLTNYNPFKPQPKVIVLDNNLIRGTIKLANAEVDGLVDFNVSELVAEREPNTENVNFNYTITWPEVKVTGDYVHNVSVIGSPYVQVKALINITYYNFHADGIFNLTTGSHQHLDDFYFNPVADRVVDSSIVTSDDSGDDSLVQKQQPLLHETSHGSALADYLSPILKDYLNSEWIVRGKDRLEVVFEHCRS